MRWVERGTLAAILLLGGHAVADTPTYGKVETFQPGKKYNCVPTADRKAWDCSESGKASEAPPEVAPRTPVQSTPEPPARPPAAALPGYLTNAAASGGHPSATPALPNAAPTAADKQVTPPQVDAKTAPQQAAPEPAQTRPAPEPAAAALVESKSQSPASQPPAAPALKITQPRTGVAAAHASAGVLQSPPSDFLALAGDQFVIELAHADAATALTEPAVPRGKVYKLHLRQNGGDRWLLLWGPFESVESARAARDEIAAQGLTPGWPRRIAPLQAEAQRSSE